MSQERSHPEAVPSVEISLPRIGPMLPERAFRLPSKLQGWLAEAKFDGLRAQIHVLPDSSFAIFTRSDRNIASSFPELKPALVALSQRHSLILDGEIIYGEGKTPGDRNKVIGRSNAYPKDLPVDEPFSFVAFDILYLDGNRLTSLPLLLRKSILNRLINASFRKKYPNIAPNHFVKGRKAIASFTEVIRTQKYEGYVLKTLDSHYRSGSHTSWLKFK